MKPEEIRNLLGGYATGTLTEEERKLLFEAALQDQDLFDALVREQALKEALEQPGAKERLLAALDTRRDGKRWLPAWLHRPWPWAVAGTAALAVMSLVVLVQVERPRSKQREVAMERAPATTLSQPQEPAAVPAPAPPAAARPAPERRAKKLSAPSARPQRPPEGKPAGEAAAGPAPATPVAERTPNQAPPVVTAATTAPPSQPSSPPPPPATPAQPPAVAPLPRPEAAARTRFSAADQAASQERPTRAEVPAGRSERAAPRGVMGALAAPAASKAMAAPRALRYRLTPDTAFQPGEPVTVHMELGETGYVYVLHRTDGGSWSAVLPPSPDAPVPAGSTLDMNVPTVAGSRELTLMLVVSPQPIADPVASAGRIRDESRARPGTVRLLSASRTPTVVTITLNAR